MEKPKFVKDLGTEYPTSTSKHRRRYSLYECPYCKEIFKGANNDMQKGDITSCGCYCTKLTGKRFYKHGLITNKLYFIWAQMKQRCTNPNDMGYKNYGDRGIVLCDDWNDNFISFYNWAINNDYVKGLQIDRVDNNGNYEPSNCRWVTRSINTQNSRLIKSSNTSGHRGVSRSGNRWQAVIRNNKIIYWLGRFNTSEEAALAYNEVALEYLGWKANLNILAEEDIKKYNEMFNEENID